MYRQHLHLGRDRIADVPRRRELPVLAEEHRSRARQIHRDQGMQQARGQAALDDEPPELGVGRERFVEVQRVVVALHLGIGTNVIGGQRQAS